MTTIALVPLRSPGRGKTRLRSVLSTDRRAALAGAMLADVVHALQGADVDRIVVAAGGPSAAAAASALGVEVLLDPPNISGLDSAIAVASQALGHVPNLLVVAADLPRLTTADVEAVLRQDAEVVVAPTRGGGTGGLLRRPGLRISTAYGVDSAVRHHALAKAAGASFGLVRAVGFHEDVDTSQDLDRLGHGALGSATRALVADWSEAAI